MRKPLLLGALALLTALPAQAAEIVVAVGRSLPPYVIAENWTGLEHDVVKGALAASGHTMIPRLMPLARVVKEMEMGQVDAAMPMLPDSGVQACYSDSHVTYRNYAITRAADNIRINSVKDLAERSVLAFQNAHLYLGAEYNEAVQANPRYREEANQVVQPLLLFLGRTEVVIADRNIYAWFAAHPEVTGKVDTRQNLRLHPIFEPTHYRVAFRSQALCEDFNRGLHSLRQSGEYDRIVALYSRFLKEEGDTLSQ